MAAHIPRPRRGYLQKLDNWVHTKPRETVLEDFTRYLIDKHAQQNPTMFLESMDPAELTDDIMEDIKDDYLLSCFDEEDEENIGKTIFFRLEKFQQERDLVHSNFVHVLKSIVLQATQTHRKWLEQMHPQYLQAADQIATALPVFLSMSSAEGYVFAKNPQLYQSALTMGLDSPISFSEQIQLAHDAATSFEQHRAVQDISSNTSS
jgi:hypothetical protein